MARPRSLQLLLDDLPDEVTVDGPSAVRVTIFNSIVKAGVVHDEIEGIECLSKKLWFVVFCERNQRQKYIDKEIELFGKTFRLKSTDPPRIQRPNYTYVKIFGYPLDTRSDILEQCMRVYGDLMDIRDDIDNTINIKTGVKTAKYTKLNEDIPSFIYAGRYHVRTSYQGQPKTCRNCGKTGHLVKDCQAGKVCRICGESGHNKGECPERRCFYCKGRGHEQNNCNRYREDFPAFGENDDNEFGPPRGWGDPLWQRRANAELNHEEPTVTVTGTTDNRGMETVGQEVHGADDETQNDGGIQNAENGGTVTVEGGVQIADGGTRSEDNGGADTVEGGGMITDESNLNTDNSVTVTVESGLQNTDGGIRSEENGGTDTVESGGMITDESNQNKDNGEGITPEEQSTNVSGSTAMEISSKENNENKGSAKERVTEGDSSDGGEAPIKKLKNNEEKSVIVGDKPTETGEHAANAGDSSDESDNLDNNGQKKHKRKGKRKNKRKPATVVSHASNRNPFMK